MKVTREEGSMSFRFTGFYGFPNAIDKERSWQLLKGLYREDGMCWTVGGDFNEILHVEEKVGGIHRAQSQIEAFKEAVNYCGLNDLQYLGYTFT